MFLCATSADNRVKEQTEDFASVFTTNLQEPILLQNFTVELVSAIITAEKNIKITDVNSKIAVRVGDKSVAEQYLVKIPTDVYKPEKLAEVLKDAVLDVIPVQGWKEATDGSVFVKCEFDAGTEKFTFKFSKLPQNDQVIKHYRFNMTSYGYKAKSTAHTNDSITLKTDFQNSKTFNNQPLFTQDVLDNFTESKSGSVVGLDVAYGVSPTFADPMERIKDYTYTGFREVGIAEQGGNFEVELTPQRCSVLTAYNRVVPALGTPSLNTAPYFVIEDKTAGTRYDSFEWENSLIHPNSKSTVRTDKSNNRYISGILLAQSLDSLGSTRGFPYDLPLAKLVFPVNETATDFDSNGIPQKHVQRREKIRSTWNNNFRMIGNTSPEYVNEEGISTNSYNQFHHRGFNLVLDETGLAPTNPNGRSVSSLALFEKPGESYSLLEKEPLEFRLAVNPLIQGGFKTTRGGPGASGGQPVLTIIKAGSTDPLEDILVPVTPTSALKIKYKLGSIGQFNSLSFGDGSTKVDGSSSGGSDRRLPYYKITKLDANDQPEVVLIVDGGEYIVAGQELVMNDPETFEVETNTNILTDVEIVDQFCSVVTPLADNIGAIITGFPNFYTSRFQYLPTTISVVNDLIFGSTDSAYTKTNGGNIVTDKQAEAKNKGDIIGANFAKDFELSVIPLSSDDSGSTVVFEVKGFVPKEDTFGTESEMYEKFKKDNELSRDMEQFFYRASPNDWATTVTYDTGRTLTNWTGFNQNDATQKLKLTISLDNYFEFSAKVQFFNGTTYTGETTLIKTFETATVSGITFNKCECTAKTRLYPYHIGFSALPGTACEDGKNEIKILNSRLANYKKNPKDIEANISHYDRNINNIVKNSDIPDIFTFPADQASIGGADLSKPPAIIKFGTRIQPTLTPSYATNDALLASDIPPTNTNYFSSPTGFAESYTGETADYVGDDLSFVGTLTAKDFPSIDTFAVELENINAKGYITESYTNQNFKKGRGVSSSIVGVVPFTEVRNTVGREEYVTLRYSAPYPQPVQINLPTETYLYNFNFRLRNIETNQYLRYLLNPTELIMRIQPDKK